MKYIRQNGQSGVETFKIQDEKILLVSNDQLIFEGKKVDDGVGSYDFFEDGIIYNKNHTTIIKGELIDKYIVINSVDLEKKWAICLERHRIEDFSYKYELLSLMDLSVILSLGVRTRTQEFLYFRDCVIAISPTMLTCYSTNLNMSIWEFDVTQFGYYSKLGRGQQLIKVEVVVGIIKGELIVMLEGNSILSIDILSGTKKYHIALNNPFNKDQVCMPLWNAYWQLHGDRLVFYRYGWYVEYDITNQEIVNSFSIEEQLRSRNLHDNTSKYIVEGDLLFFYISGFGSFSLPTLAILDIRKQEVIWSDVWDNDKVFYRDFQKGTNKLFALDSEKCLHVFERIG